MWSFGLLGFWFCRYRRNFGRFFSIREYDDIVIGKLIIESLFVIVIVDDDFDWCFLFFGVFYICVLFLFVRFL